MLRPIGFGSPRPGPPPSIHGQARLQIEEIRASRHYLWKRPLEGQSAKGAKARGQPLPSLIKTSKISDDRCQPIIVALTSEWVCVWFMVSALWREVRLYGGFVRCAGETMLVLWPACREAGICGSVWPVLAGWENRIFGLFCGTDFNYEYKLTLWAGPFFTLFTQYLDG